MSKRQLFRYESIRQPLLSREAAGRPPLRGFAAAARDIAVVTADIPLAARCLGRGARVLNPKCRPWTDNDIGGALAMREPREELRQAGELTGAPSPMTPKDRSRFLSKLDETANAVRRAHPEGK